MLYSQKNEQAQRQLEKGIKLFNSRHFFECHDAIEEIWMEWRGSDRTFFQGLIQVAVGLYHLGNKNYRGARSQLAKGITKLQRYRPSYREVELERFLEETGECLRHVELLEQGVISEEFNEPLLPTLTLLNR